MAVRRPIGESSTVVPTAAGRRCRNCTAPLPSLREDGRRERTCPVSQRQRRDLAGLIDHPVGQAPRLGSVLTRLHAGQEQPRCQPDLQAARERRHRNAAVRRPRTRRLRRGLGRRFVLTQDRRHCAGGAGLPERDRPLSATARRPPSFGGAAVIAAAHEITSVQAVARIGAPYDPDATSLAVVTTGVGTEPPSACHQDSEPGIEVSLDSNPRTAGSWGRRVCLIRR